MLQLILRHVRWLCLHYSDLLPYILILLYHLPQPPVFFFEQCTISFPYPANAAQAWNSFSFHLTYGTATKRVSSGSAVNRHFFGVLIFLCCWFSFWSWKIDTLLAQTFILCQKTSVHTWILLDQALICLCIGLRLLRKFVDACIIWEKLGPLAKINEQVLLEKHWLLDDLALIFSEKLSCIVFILCCAFYKN